MLLVCMIRCYSVWKVLDGVLLVLSSPLIILDLRDPR